MSESTPEGVHALAESIAREIVARQGSQPVTIESLTDMSGSFVLAIVYNDVTYTLTVTIPTGAGSEYVFSLTQTPKGSTTPQDIASFKYKDSTDWAVAVGLPAPITFGGVTLQTLKLSLGEGTVS
ncbi:hypothetical protein [Nocardioides caricicola]|uniref:Uncharacterized protein n=1 Tax=Nocardioides caricicola TaxID=634770 RepID=A0ABW0N258_9ACTN